MDQVAVPALRLTNHSAAALGLVEDESVNDSLTGMIQVMNRYLLERMSSDYKQILPHSSMFEQV